MKIHITQAYKTNDGLVHATKKAAIIHALTCMDGGPKGISHGSAKVIMDYAEEVRDLLTFYLTPEGD